MSVSRRRPRWVLPAAAHPADPPGCARPVFFAATAAVPLAPGPWSRSPQASATPPWTRCAGSPSSGILLVKQWPVQRTRAGRAAGRAVVAGAAGPPERVGVRLLAETKFYTLFAFPSGWAWPSRCSVSRPAADGSPGCTFVGCSPCWPSVWHTPGSCGMAHPDDLCATRLSTAACSASGPTRPS